VLVFVATPPEYKPQELGRPDEPRIEDICEEFNDNTQSMNIAIITNMADSAQHSAPPNVIKTWKNIFVLKSSFDHATLERLAGAVHPPGVNEVHRQ
jgi:hypothetical protein